MPSPLGVVLLPLEISGPPALSRLALNLLSDFNITPPLCAANLSCPYGTHHANSCAFDS